MATRGINRATVLGYLGREPRITITGNGSLRAHISIATTETWQDETGEMVERTDWHQIVASVSSPKLSVTTAKNAQNCTLKDPCKPGNGSMETG